MTTDHGSWVIIKSEEYEALFNKKMAEDLYADFEKRGIIITHKNYNQIIEKHYLRYQYIDNPPALHIIAPSLECNFNCVYCHSAATAVSSTGPKMDEKTLKRVLEFIFRSPSRQIRIEFNGGEPLLHKDIIRRAVLYTEELNNKYKKQYQISIVTNLTLMTDDFLDFIAQHSTKISVYVSLDGPEAVHDWNRKFAYNHTGTYKKVTAWLYRLKARDIRVVLLMVITKHSLAYWKEIVDEYVKWGMTSFYLKPLECAGYAKKKWDEIGYKAGEFTEFWQKCVDYTFSLLEKGIIIMDYNLLFGLQNILSERNTGFLDFTSPCGLIRGQLVYNEYGDIYCCNLAKIFSEFKVGNVYDDADYESILNSKKAKKLILSSMVEGYYCDSCAYKPFCAICPVSYYAKDGNSPIKLNRTGHCSRHRAMYDYIFDKILYQREKIEMFLKSYYKGKRIA